MDLDNCYSMLKPYIDGLKASGVIKDDSWSYINGENYKVDQTKSKFKKIILRIEEL
jgi:Holliday junction resolvase RusA-like endonuclease